MRGIRYAMRVLLVEDDGEQADFVIRGLLAAGHEVEHAQDGPGGLQRAREAGFDALVLDRMLPRLDGLALLRQLRAAAVTTPVLILSALAEVDDRVEGLRAGGDDYLAKPFAIVELLARLEALARRHAPAPRLLKVADLELDLGRLSVTRAGRRIELKPKELQLLTYLMQHADQVVTRSMLLEGVWGYHFDPTTNVIDVHISYLRAKLDGPGLTPIIHTVRGAGYRLGPPLD